MNENARKFFDENPSEPYWYYSPTLRVVNTRLKPWLHAFVPWPTERNVIGRRQHGQAV